MATLRALECLVALVDTGSVSTAARALHLSQPALSHQIAALEKELGTPVVQRLARGVRPTAAGLAAAGEARVTLRSAERVVEIGRRVGLGEAGRLRIACAETMITWLLVPVLRRWRSRHPEVVLDLSEFNSADTMAGRVADGTIDLAIGPRPTVDPEHSIVLGQEEILVVASAKHRFAGQETVVIRALRGEPFVHYHPDNGMAVVVDQLAAKHGVTLQPVLRTLDPATAAQLAAAGMGVTIVPASALSNRPAGAVRRLRPSEQRDLIVTIASPADTLVRRFVADLVQRGVPATPGVPDTT
jgi:DNA-binding transcriptional LysR family regulator